MDLVSVEAKKNLLEHHIFDKVYVEFETYVKYL